MEFPEKALLNLAHAELYGLCFLNARLHLPQPLARSRPSLLHLLPDGNARE